MSYALRYIYVYWCIMLDKIGIKSPLINLNKRLDESIAESMLNIENCFKESDEIVKNIRRRLRNSAKRERRNNR